MKGEEEKIADLTTVPKLVNKVRAVNPNSPLSEYGVRLGIRSGAIPATKIGNRYLVTVQDVFAYYRYGGKKDAARNDRISDERVNHALIPNRGML